MPDPVFHYFAGDAPEGNFSPEAGGGRNTGVGRSGAALVVDPLGERGTVAEFPGINSSFGILESGRVSSATDSPRSVSLFFAGISQGQFITTTGQSPRGPWPLLVQGGVIGTGTSGARGYPTFVQEASGTGWHHLAAVYEGASGVYNIYLDGLLIVSLNMPTGVSPDFNYNRIGGANNGGRFSEYMSDFRVYDVALTAEDVAAQVSGGGGGGGYFLPKDGSYLLAADGSYLLERPGLILLDLTLIGEAVSLFSVEFTPEFT